MTGGQEAGETAGYGPIRVPSDVRYGRLSPWLVLV